MTDRELLEKAARAAGYEFSVGMFGIPCISEKGSVPLWWDPLDHDGDALRLAVKMGLQVYSSDGECLVTAWSLDDDLQEFYEHWEGDPCAATRRAIVRAAAAIGETMP